MRELGQLPVGQGGFFRPHDLAYRSCLAAELAEDLVLALLVVGCLPLSEVAVDVQELF